MLRLDCPVPFSVSIGIYLRTGGLAAGGMHTGNSGGLAGESITAGSRFITAQQVTCHLLRYAALDVIIARSIELRCTASHRDNASRPDMNSKRHRDYSVPHTVSCAWKILSETSPWIHAFLKTKDL